MGRFRVIFVLLLSLFLWSCGGAERPVSLPIPFAGALNPDSRIVVASGNPVGGANLSLSQKGLKAQAQGSRCPEDSLLTPLVQFENFNSNGSFTGCTDMAEGSVVTRTPFLDDFRDTFTTRTAVTFNNGDRAAATLDFFDFPYTDPNIVVPPGSELRKGVGSAIIQDSDGSFNGSENKGTMTFRYVAVSRLVNNQRVFDQIVESSWVLNRVNGGAVEFGASEGKVLAVLILNGFDENIPGVPTVDPLFCEGQDPDDEGSACGSLEFTVVGGEEQNGQRINSILNLVVCEGDSCLPTTNAVFVDDFIPELTSDLIAAITDDVMETGMGMSLLTGGIADSAVMTRQDPLSCDPNDPNDQPQLTGKFRIPGCEGRLKLDYRCMLLLNPMTGESFTFAGTFIISEIE